MQAGAWLREKGSTFTSISFTSTWFLETANATYLEFGVRDDLTLGIDANIYRSPIQGQAGTVTLFLRRPLGDRDGKHRWAYELGVGADWIGDVIIPHVRTGISWGRGFSLGEKNGWMAVDASVNWDLGQGLHLTKIDSTLGLSLSDRFSGMLQVYLGSVGGESYGTLAPSFIFAPRKTKFKLQLGAEARVGAFENTGLKIGLWREF
ncbi:hypothetical protein C1J03_20040 [Sulfitobacter sp. SK012]|nr:hypothetical protein C1J03_20040 [Sulfitobacter sp. SK012]